MIRFRLAGLGAEEASRLEHPALQRLAGRGPWAYVDSSAGCVLTRGSAAAWGPWRPGRGGLEYALAEPMPAWDDAWLIQHRAGVPVLLRSGVVLSVVPVPYDGLALDILTGELGEPIGDYGTAVAEAFGLLTAGGSPALNHPLLVGAAREILLRSVRLPLEALAAYAVVGTADLVDLVEAAAALPKAACGAGGCAAAPPASTPTA